MATTVTKTRARKLPDPNFDGVPYGNVAALDYHFETNSSGIMVDSDQATAILKTNIVILGIINGGMKLEDAVAIVSDAFTSSATMDIGFQYVDGVDDADVPQDADYFFDGAAMDALARLRMSTTNPPVILPKDAYLTVTPLVADLDAVGVLDVLVYGAMVGRP